jgi:hypothetical protein
MIIWYGTFPKQLIFMLDLKFNFIFKKLRGYFARPTYIWRKCVVLLAPVHRTGLPLQVLPGGQVHSPGTLICCREGVQSV